MKSFSSLAVLLVTLALAAGLDRGLLALRQLTARTFEFWPGVWLSLAASLVLAGCWLALAWLFVFRGARSRAAAAVCALIGLLIVASFPLGWFGPTAGLIRNPWPALLPNWPPAPNTLLGQAGAAAFVIGLGGLLRRSQPRNEGADAGSETKRNEATRFSA
ncbi:MAG TPA: hypothetical protein VGA61_16655, partial [Anaerolineae bacterium]